MSIIILILHSHPLLMCYYKKKTEEEIDTMSSEQAKALAHELTMEYVRQHRDLLSDVISKIPDMTAKIADINQRFYDAIRSNDTLNKLY